MKTQYTSIRITLFILLLVFNTFSSCVHKRQAFSSGWTLGYKKLEYTSDTQSIIQPSRLKMVGTVVFFGLVLTGLLYYSSDPAIFNEYIKASHNTSMVIPLEGEDPYLFKPVTHIH